VKFLDITFMAANAVGIVLYLLLASRGWRIPQEHGMVPVTGEPFVWVLALPAALKFPSPPTSRKARCSAPELGFEVRDDNERARYSLRANFEQFQLAVFRRQRFKPVERPKAPSSIPSTEANRASSSTL